MTGDVLGLVVVLISMAGIYWLLFRGVLKERSGGRSFLSRRYSDDSLLESTPFNFLSGITTSAAALTIYSVVGLSWSLATAVVLGVFYGFASRDSVTAFLNRKLRGAVEGAIGFLALVPAIIQFGAQSVSCQDVPGQWIAIVVSIAIGLVAFGAVGANLHFGLNRNGNGSLDGLRGFLAAYGGLEILRFFWSPLGMTWFEIGFDFVWLGVLGGLLTIVGLLVVPQLVTALGGLALFASLLFVESTTGTRCSAASLDAVAVLAAYVAVYVVTRTVIGMIRSRSRASR